MHYEHADHPGRLVRLGYCMNLHPAEDLAGVLEGMRRITVPLAARLRPDDAAPFGVGLWLPAAVARELAASLPDGAAFTALRDFVAGHRLDAFTFNAFPFGGFHRPGLKADVFRPTWLEPERLAFTLDVARVACALAGGRGGIGHVSISTHAGGWGDWVRDDAERERVAQAFVLCVAELARLERETDVRVVLAIEPEPRSTANDTRELGELFARVRRAAGGEGVDEPTLMRHLGTCLDACHAAVEFEDPSEAFDRSSDGVSFGKLQYSSALSLPAPARSPEGRAALLEMAEPVYLHQVTGRGSAGAGLVRVADLPELEAECSDSNGGEAPTWSSCAEWRCHFHVPVDRGSFAGGRLQTTRGAARAALARALAAPERWGSAELHVEVETYTWDVLPGGAEEPAGRVAALERELRAVQTELSQAGWQPRESSARAV